MARALLLLSCLAVALALSHGASFRPQQETAGGFVQKADVSEEGVQQMVAFALSVYNAANNDQHLSRTVQVVSAQHQVTAGTNYYLSMEIGRTTCAKSQSNRASCPFQQQDLLKNQRCNFVIYNRPWENYISVTSFSCHDA
ncbi:PREDICTED: cystatin-C-like isoform X2 [Chinchilla lanigera]|nr:PREDICTED: cystatin-C-like isoform X2 [Chinchilla lanigera]